MTLTDRVVRAFKKGLTNPGVLLGVVLFIIIYQYFYADKVWVIYERVKVRLQLRLTGRYDQVPTSADKEITGAHRTRASWQLKKSNVAVYAIQGRRPHMEDRFNIVTDLEHTNTSIYGIFDGHGGEFAAEYAEKTLFKSIMVRLLKSTLADKPEDFGAVLTEEILAVDQQLLQVEKLTNEFSGSTVLISLLSHNKLTVANVGDSRGVICDRDNKAVPLSFDHKPQQMREKRRIRKAGGFISFNGVWRVAGVLATSRALGDYPLKDRNLVIAEPDILTFDLDKMKPKFMILATDGLWDAFSNEEAVAFVSERLDEPHFGAKSLVLQAYYRGSLDNITVMVVDFTNRTS
ncbi:Protein phosphatase 1L [Lamellibrachia satsuma]|nr:Protein phosphatase 1L [Lamellibrachia satsuma]